MTDLDWVAEAKKLFSVEKPEHFTDYQHCYECNEHDQTLMNSLGPDLLFIVRREEILHAFLYSIKPGVDGR